ncbi:MAG: radical SAM family heme chaperone HemW [Lachnospiraceae bacterium]|nr:radical SAM family heme chaperone HemW [Lachnospiraceae bacterium]
MNHKEQIGIYVHIPFCVRKCAYCDFLSFPAQKETKERYIDILCKQIDATEDPRSVASVYFGGGTPSVVEPMQIERILCKLKERFAILPDAEITVEVNPGTVTPEYLKIYRDAGVNRLSIGLQSANEEELKMLGRIHTYADFLHTYEDARSLGFANINVDLMTALPGQDAQKLSHTLKCILALKPEHISAYSLIIEEGTPFFERYGSDRSGLPDEDTERRLYYLTRDMLTGNGYRHYEISNFAGKGFESRHNSACWRREDYLGFGLGAASLCNNRRFRNTTDLKQYLTDPLCREEEIVLERKDCMEEFMFLGLRMLEGVSEEDFSGQFKVSLSDVYGEVIGKLLKTGLIMREKGRIKLTDEGIDHGNYVFSQFLFT